MQAVLKMEKIAVIYAPKNKHSKKLDRIS